MSEPFLNADLKALEGALKQLAPAGQVQRDTLMFRAGRASAPQRGWLWPAAAAGMTVVTVALGSVLMLRPAPLPAEKIVYVTVREPAPPLPAAEQGEPIPPQPPPAAPLTHPTTEYQQMKRLALRWGVENLPTSSALSSAQEPP